jgi:hypothetical protein
LRLVIPRMSARAQPIAILPSRDGDPVAPSRFAPGQGASADEILRCAESFGIPWRRILVAEIEAEEKLRRYLPDVQTECPLATAQTVLSFDLLRSWRVRDRIESLACQSRGGSLRSAVRELRRVFQRLTGKGDRDQVALARHFWFAYQRVLLLQRVLRYAWRSCGTTAERLAFVCSRAGCCYDDAAWAVCLEGALLRAQRLEAVVRHVRDEGFLIPRAETEARSLSELRRIVLTSPHLTRRRSARGRTIDAEFSPRRVRLPLDTP